MYIYSAKCLKVVDGDTIDARVDLGFDTFKKIEIQVNISYYYYYTITIR